MNTLKNKRKIERINISSNKIIFRHCDMDITAETGDLDVIIIDISPLGMKVQINSDENRYIRQDDEIIIRGCIFNDSIGFLSNQKAVAVWLEGTRCGLKFVPSLDIDSSQILAMLGEKNVDK